MRRALMVSWVCLFFAVVLTGCGESSSQSTSSNRPLQPQPSSKSETLSWAASKFITVKQAVDAMLIARGYAPFGNPLEDHSMAVYYQGRLGLALAINKRENSVELTWDMLFTEGDAKGQMYAAVAFEKAWEVFSADSRAFREAFSACLKRGESTRFVQETFVAELNCKIHKAILEVIFRPL